MSTFTFETYLRALRAAIAQCNTAVLFLYSRELKRLFVNDRHWAGVLALAKARGESAQKLEEAPLLLESVARRAIDTFADASTLPKPLALMATMVSVLQNAILGRTRRERTDGWRQVLPLEVQEVTFKFIDARVGIQTKS